MNSRERVLKTLNHQEPDGVPVDIGGMRSTGIEALAYKQLRNYLHLNDRPMKLYDVWQQLAYIDDDVLEYFQGDVRSIDRMYPVWWSPDIKIDKWKEGQLSDGTKALVPENFSPIKKGKFYVIKNRKGEIVAKRSEDGLYYDHVGVYHPLAKATNIDELKKQYRDLFPTGQDITAEEQDYLRTISEELRKNTDYALLAYFGGSLFEMGQYLRGYEQWFLDIAENKEKRMASCLLDLLLEDYLEGLDTFMNVLGGNADIIGFGGEDLGMQTGPQISRATYRQLFKPGHKEMWGVVRRRSTYKVFLHSCGSITQLLPDIIEAGADIINPVHTNARDMEPERLKREFGKDIVFWGGGCDTQRVLPQGTLQDIEEEVKKNISVFAPGGGFVFAAVHNIQPDVSPQKIVKLYKTAFTYGKQVYSASS